MAILVDTDVLLVNRADETYQMTFAELEASVNSKLQNGLTLSGDPLPTFDDSDLFIVNRDDTTYKVSFAEIINSISLGIPPVLTNVSLVENNPGVSPRFTSQAFTASTNLSVDGIPQSEKTFDAFVEGSLYATYTSDPITAVSDSSIADVPYNFPDTNTFCRNIATDGNGHWLALNTSSITNQVGYYIGTGDTYPTFGGFRPAEYMFDGGMFGICGSTNGRFIMTGLQTGGPNGFKLSVAYSDDYGQSWVPSTIVSDKFINKTDSLTITTDDNGKWFIGGTDNTNQYVYSIISTDNGVSFTVDEITSGGSAFLYCVGMSKDTLIMGGNGFYFISTNGGTTWSEKITSLNFGFQSAAGSKKGTMLCARDSAGNQIARFVDGVFVETINTPAPGSFSSIVSVGGNNWYAASYSTSYQSSDDGRTWVSMGPVGVQNPTASNALYVKGTFVTCGGNKDPSILQGAINSALPGVTALTVSGEKDLVNITEGAAVNNGEDPSSPDYAIGQVYDVIINGADSKIDIIFDVGTWQVGQNVETERTLVNNARKYLDFDSNGNVSSLLDAPQSPAYVTTDLNPGLTLTFPATFPSGLTPDEELGDGTTLTVEVTAENDAGTSGPLSATVQPEPDNHQLQLHQMKSCWISNTLHRRQYFK